MNTNHLQQRLFTPCRTHGAMKKERNGRQTKPSRVLAAIICLTMLAVSGGCATGGDAATRAANEAEQSVTVSSEAQTGTTSAPEGTLAPMGGGMAMSSTGTAVTVEPSPATADISDRDRQGTWEADGAIEIVCTGKTAAISSVGATITDGVLTITRGGTYVLSGSLTGRIVVSATKDDKIQLVLNALSVTSGDGPALWVTQADKTFVTLESGTQNTLTDGSAYSSEICDDEGEPDACIFSKDDLTINGAGALTVNGGYKHGIVTKNDLVLVDAQLAVNAAGDGLKGTDAVYVSGNAGVSVTASSDAVQTKGVFVLESGKMTLTAGDDGIQADENLTVRGGTVNILESCEGMESLMLCVTGGDVSIVASDDGMNATAASTDTTGASAEAEDAAAATGLATPALASEPVEQPNEKAQPNAAGAPQPGQGGAWNPGETGGDGRVADEAEKFAFVEGALIAVTGGTVNLQAGGDGLDSNGDLLITGGTVYVSCLDGTADSALDYNGGAAVTGGVVMAAGSAGMAATFGVSSTQAVLTVTAESALSGGVQVRLTNASGETLASFTPVNDWQNIVISAPGLAVGQIDTLLCGDATVCETELTDTLTTYGSAVGLAGGGGFDGGKGGGARPAGMQGNPGPNGGGPGAPNGQTDAPDAQSGATAQVQDNG